jgi:chromosomal replication initiation ATPase DnaA
MDGLGHAIWASKAERKFRPEPQITVDNSEIIKRDNLINELEAKISRLTLQNNTLSHRIYQLQKMDVPLSRIIAVVAKHFGINPKQIIAQDRNKSITYPRHLIVYLAKKLSALSFPVIGRHLRRDHTTALNSYWVIEDRKLEPKIAADLAILERLIVETLCADTQFVINASSACSQVVVAAPTKE